MVDAGEEIEGLQNKSTNREFQSSRAKGSSAPGNPAADAVGSSAFDDRFNTFFGGGPYLLYLHRPL